MASLTSSDRLREVRLELTVGSGGYLEIKVTQFEVEPDFSSEKKWETIVNDVSPGDLLGLAAELKLFAAESIRRQAAPGMSRR